MIFDGHGDILPHVAVKMIDGKDIFKEYHLPKYLEAEVMGSIFVNYTDPDSPNQRQDFKQITDIALPYFKNSEYVNVVYKASDFKLGKLNVILGIEGAKPLADLQAVKAAFNQGYRHIGLTWNERNQFGCGVSAIGGLTESGEEVIKWCNQNGMIIDFAHLNYQSFIEAALISNKPILFSHGNAFELCNHPRNLEDDQLMLIKESDGVIGIAAISQFLVPKGEATIDDFAKHIMYVQKRIGTRHVGLGLDFCHYLDDIPNNDVRGLENLNDISKLRNILRKEGLHDTEIEDILYNNFARVVKAHLDN